MFTHLLVPLDGSKLAETALPMALAIAGRFESAITLLRVVAPPHFVVNSHDFAQLYVSLYEDMHEEATTYIRLKQNEMMSGGFVANGRVAEGDSIADIILDAADELGVDAIVMCTHGRGGIKRWVFGSVADRILQQACVPILLVRARPSERFRPSERLQPSDRFRPSERLQPSDRLQPLESLQPSEKDT